MKKLIKLGLLVILISTLFASSPVLAADSGSPTIYSLSFDRTVAYPGDMVLVSVDASDPDGIDYIYVELYSVGSGSDPDQYETGLYLYENGTVYAGEFEIGQYWPNTELYINYLSVNDQSGYSYTFYNGTDFTSPLLNLEGTTPDDTPPTLNNMWYSTSTATAGDTVTVFFDVSDDLSGFNYGWAEVYRDTNPSNDYWDDTYYVGFDLFYDSVSGNYVIELLLGEWIASGGYYVGYFYMYDFAGNYITYYNSTGSTNHLNYGSFYVDNPNEDPNPPTLNDMSYSTATATAGETVTVFFDITDDVSGFDYGWASVYRDTDSSNDYWNDEYYRDYGIVYNSTLGNYTIDVELGEWVASGSYYVGYMYMYDKAGNYIYYENSTGSPNPLNYGSFYVDNPNEDLNPPNMDGDPWIIADTVNPGLYHTIYANLGDDKSGVSYAYGELYYVSTTTLTLDSGGYLTGAYFYYDSNLGIWAADVWIPSDANLGHVAIEYMYIYDNANNYQYLENGLNYTSPIIEITDTPVPGDMFVGFTPNNGTAQIGSSVDLGFDITNNMSRLMYGWIDIYVSGPEEYFLYENWIELRQGESFTDYINVWFNFEGLYEITIYFYSEYSSHSWNATSVWNVEGSKGEISVEVNPNYGESKTGENVYFEASIYSSFSHDMYDIEIYIVIYHLGHNQVNLDQNTYEERRNFDLYSQSYAYEGFDVTFRDIGEYEIFVAVYDDIGAEWSFKFNWNVVDEGGNSTPPDDDDSGNDSIEPSLAFDLPGFEVGITLISLSSLLILAVRRREY